jgi:hypothetical protein
LLHPTIRLALVLTKISVRGAVMVEEIKRKLYLEVDKYKAVEKGEYRELIIGT